MQRLEINLSYWSSGSGSVHFTWTWSLLICLAGQQAPGFYLPLLCLLVLALGTELRITYSGRKRFWARTTPTNNSPHRDMKMDAIQRRQAHTGKGISELCLSLSKRWHFLCNSISFLKVTRPIQQWLWNWWSLYWGYQAENGNWGESWLSLRDFQSGGNPRWPQPGWMRSWQLQEKEVSFK